MINNYDVWYDMLNRTMNEGHISAPRGQRIREIEDLQIRLDPMRPFMNFTHRKLKIDYFKKEMLWKLGADAFDSSIMDHAKMWASVRNTDGSFNSNYGQYWFGKQLGLMKAFNELVRDVNTRRSIIPMLNDSHIGPNVNDTVCTEAVGFRIRDNCLNMSVHMRSSDQIFGLGTDIPTFAFLMRILHGMLLTVFPNLRLGTLTITAMSSHIYERHFKMVDEILRDPQRAACTIMPVITEPSEAFRLAACAGHVNGDWGKLSRWLLTPEE